jgi:hypothetical protein
MRETTAPLRCVAWPRRMNLARQQEGGIAGHTGKCPRDELLSFPRGLKSLDDPSTACGVAPSVWFLAGNAAALRPT